MHWDSAAMEHQANFVKSYLCTISPYIFCFHNFNLIDKIIEIYFYVIYYYFCLIFVSFSLTWAHNGEKNQTASPRKVYSRFTPKILPLFTPKHTRRDGLYKVVQRIVKLKFWLLPFYFCFVHLGPCGSKCFKGHQQIHYPKSMCTLKEGLYVKEMWNLQFESLT